ncbi:MAG: MaoC family dehydratase N-terminal domain-containing protein, partial [Burkholderiaceae bacterium]
HWLYFLPIAPMSAVGTDGHPTRGGFLPPVPLPRRMWAASRLVFHRPLQVGDTLTRVSEITDVQLKEGKSGPLVFVKLMHTVMSSDGATAITEEQDIVYRDDPNPGDAPAAAKPAPPDADWCRELQPDPVLLFRYSALTFNGHRIHYDRPYATSVEGYPGLVVHGPLIATLLIDHLRRHLPEATVARFEFRALRPLFDGAPFMLNGQPAPDGHSVRLWARDAGGALCMEASAALA